MAHVTACSTLGYCNFDVRTAATQIAARGFERIELCHLGAYCLHYSPGSQAARGLKQLFAELGLRPVAMNFSTAWTEGGRLMTPNAADPAEARRVEDTVKRLLDDLALLGVPLLNVSCGRRMQGEDARDRMRAWAKLVGALGEHAAGLGIRLTLEVPHCYLLYHDLARTAEMFSLITSANVGALLDSSHWTVLRYDLDEWWEAVGGRLWHVHLRDARGVDTGDFQQELEYTAGRGECDFRALSQWLDARSYQGEVSIEFEYRDPVLTMEDIEGDYDFGLAALSRSGWTLSTAHEGSALGA